MLVKKLIASTAAMIALGCIVLAQPNARPNSQPPGQPPAKPIPLDPAVRTGKLPNGFTYYIRHNEEPAKRVQLYLVNKAGSILEDEDQRGLAHFMEHMNFNGTTHFPKNELVDYLQKAGVRFGADLNAYTSFDETVYQLPLPTEDPSLVANGLQIMRDWAQEATLDSVELEKERGVVLEEERLGKGAKDRMSRQYYPVLLNHARYAERIPIGLDSVLIHFKPAAIRRFHHDWYRPDLQALIVVGDIDAAAIEKMIRENFSSLKNPAAERPRTTYTVPLTGQEQFLTVTDKEAAATELEVLIKHKASPMKTDAVYLAAMKRSLFNSLLSERRYAELSREPNPSFVSASMGIQGLMGGLDMFAFAVTAKEGQLQRAFQQTWDVLEQVRRFGFTPSELDRAKQNYLRGMENAMKEKNKMSSASLVGEYQHHFLQGEAAPGIDWESTFVKEHIASITLEDITAVSNEYLKGIDRDILVTAPEKEKGSLPDAATVKTWIQVSAGKEMVAYKDEKASGTLLTDKLTPGKIVAAEKVDALNVTRLTLSNGVRVVLKPTDFKNNEISFKSFAPGGVSLYNDSDYEAAASASQMIGSFGVGDFNPVQLSKLLTGKSVRVGPYIGARSQGVTGATTTGDLETALQLVYLEYTHPRMDSVLYNNIISGSRSVLPNRYAEPGNVFSDTMAYVMGNYNYRASPPTLEKLNGITLQKVYTIYKERFADASGATFVFVGNFNTDSIRPLLERYLGALPSLHKNEQARNLGIHIPPGQMIKNVYAGKEDKAMVRLVFSGSYQYSPENNQYLHALGQVLQIKLLQHLREEESEVYSPSVQTAFNKYPENRYAVIVAFGCAPKNVDHLSVMVEREMDSLRMNGADPVDVEKYKASYKKSMELALKDNGYWLGYLSGQYENNDDVLQVLSADKTLDKVTSASLKEAAGLYLKGENRIRFALLPENASSKNP